jgi:small subunit ribosomal protein S4
MLKGDKCNTQKCPMVSRNYPPGIHGPRLGRRQRLSDYAMQLKEKQKAKKQYRIMENQFKTTFEKAVKKQGDIGKNFLVALELRLDNVVYRSGLASSRDEARQIVNHGHIQVNDKKVNIPSYKVKEGDVIAVKKTSAKKKRFKDITEKLKKYEAPGWLHLNKDELSGKVLHSPDVEELERNINTQMIVEHYSK